MAWLGKNTWLKAAVALALFFQVSTMVDWVREDYFGRVMDKVRNEEEVAALFDAVREADGIALAGSRVSVTMVYPGFVSTGVQARGFGADGQPLGRNPIQMSEVITTAAFAHIILDAAARRRREEVMTLRGKLGPWLKLIAPALIDRIALKAIKEELPTSAIICAKFRPFGYRDAF